MVVPDASVILKWCLTENEADRDKAIAIRDAAIAGRAELWVPPLSRFEIGNILTRRRPEQAEELLALCEISGLREISPEPEWQAQAIKLVIKYGVTFYDASYHALALIHQGTFVTADARYIAKAKKSGHVVHLADWA